MSLKGVGSTLAAIVAVVVALAFLPFAVVFASFEDARLVRRLADATCPRCGAAFGRAAVAAARERWNEQRAQIRSANPGVRFRVLVKWQLICPDCGSVYTVMPGAKDPVTLHPGTAA